MPSSAEGQSRQYRRQAEMLAVYLDYRSPLPPSEVPVTPGTALVDSLERALQAIDDFRHPARDSVLEIFNIGPRLGWDPYTLHVETDSLAPWLDSWRRGEVPTNVAGIDSVLLSVVASVAEGPPRNRRAFELKAQAPLNWYALRERIIDEPHVEAVYPDLYIGGGNGVDVERNGTGWQVTYSLRWGDCPSGCIHRHWWAFAVDEGWEVRFLGGGGAQIGGGL